MFFEIPKGLQGEDDVESVQSQLDVHVNISELINRINFKQQTIVNST